MPPRKLWPDAALFALALGLRLGIAPIGGGFTGKYVDYDSGVYYAAGMGLVHGRLPYRDFLLVHPPVIAYVLAPFAALGRLTTDDIGYLAANVAFAAIGALNAVLVTHVARRAGVNSAAALAGGAFYAVWYGAIESEYLCRLEGLGNLFLLLALLVAVRSWNGSRSSRSALLGVGALLAVAVNVKIWFVVPLAVVVCWEAVGRRSWRGAAALLSGALAACAVLDLPVFLPAPSQMWDMVVAAQVGRGANARSSLGVRLGQLSTLDQAGLDAARRPLLVAAGCVLAAAVALAAWRRATRPFAALLLAQAAVLLAAPSWFPFYTDYLAAPGALVLAAAAARLGRTGTLGAWVPVAAAATLTALALPGAAGRVEAVPDRQRLADAVAPYPCVMADDPMTLIELDALSRSFAPGCHDWVDVTARRLGVGKAADRVQPGRPNPTWSADLRDYLLSGDAVVITRVGIGITGATRAAARAGGLIASDGVYAVYRTRRR